MRFANLIPAALVLCLSSAAFAQAEWAEFASRQDNFSVNFPGQPQVEDLQYRTAADTTLPARTYTARDARGQYTTTVVDYRNASPEEQASAIEEASDVIRAKGPTSYDGFEHVSQNISRRITIETQDTRLFAEVLMSEAKRLYILEAATPLEARPPAAFGVSLQLLDDNGELIEAPGQSYVGQFELGDSASPEEDFYNNPAAVEAAVKGTWRIAGGSCEAAYLKPVEPVKNDRGITTGLKVAINNGDMMVDGTLVLAGARRSQIVSLTNANEVLFLTSADGDTMQMIPIGGQVLGWPGANLERCP